MQERSPCPLAGMRGGALREGWDGNGGSGREGGREEMGRNGSTKVGKGRRGESLNLKRHCEMLCMLFTRHARFIDQDGFSAECNSKRILKILQHLATTRT